MAETAEARRLREEREGRARWRQWGPYLSERQWGTVREDYSPSGTAWDYFPHDHARSRAYRWGEDGLAGFSDDEQRLCLGARAVERTRPDPQGAPLRPDQRRGQPRRGRQGVLLLPRRHPDPLLQPDALQVSAGASFPTPTWSRRTAVAGNGAPEFELIDTGVFDEDRYFDVFVEYAKAGPDDILMQDHRAQPRTRPGATPPAAAALVPQHLVLAPRRRATRASRQPARGPGSLVQHPTLGTVRSWMLEGAPESCCSPRTRPTSSRLYGAEQPGPLQGRVPRAIVGGRPRGA